MNVTKRSTTFNISSSTSSHMDTSEDMESVYVKNYVKDLLKSRIFLGRYLERRLIDERIGYRDVVLLSAAEVELKRDLADAQHKLQKAYPYIQWIGISDSETIGHQSGTCIWTEIDNEPFGVFWFQVKSIKFRDSEIIILLKCIRHITEAFIEIEPILTSSIDSNKVDKKAIEAKLNEAYSEVTINLKNMLSISNVKEFVTFLFAFVIAVFTGSTAFVNFIGNFILALIREMSIFVKNSTPIFLGFLDFLSKIVGGFYILMAMFFKPNNPNPLNKRRIPYYDRPQQDYNPREFD